MENIPYTHGDNGMKIKAIRRIYSSGNKLEIVTKAGIVFYADINEQ